VTLRHTPTPEQLSRLRDAVPDFDEGGGYRVESDTIVSFDFDGRNYLNLRRVIDEVNSWSDQSSS
jgi:hypothetical protein